MSTKHGPATYPLWCIATQGAVWGNRYKSAADTIAEVELMVTRAKEAEAHCPAYKSDWLTRKYQGFDDNGKTAVVTRPVTIEIEVGSTVYFKGPVIARWVAGERVL